MNTYENKVVLVAGNLNMVEVSLIQNILDCGAKEVRILGGNETAMQALREQLLLQTPDAISRLRCYIGTLGESDYVREAAMGANLVLCLPAVCPNEDCERNPADACLTLLEPVENYIRLVTKSGAEKVVVISPNHQEPLVAMNDMIAVLLETTVVAEARYQGPNSSTVICCARMDGGKFSIKELFDYALKNAVNGDFIIIQDGEYKRKPCTNFDFQREDKQNNIK